MNQQSYCNRGIVQRNPNSDGVNYERSQEIEDNHDGKTTASIEGVGTLLGELQDMLVNRLMEPGRIIR